MRMLFISRIDSRDALMFTEQLVKDLQAHGHDIIIEEETAAALGCSGIALSKARSDIVVVVGGDGTILRSVQQMDHQIPLIGINWGEVGFLADLEPKKARDFLLCLPEKFAIEKRMRVRLEKDGEHLGDALNEALIITTRPAKMLLFSILIDGVMAEQFRADGLLISTPTGSTAYAMSAGGPIVDPGIQGIVLVPLAPYMLSSRPHVISSGRRIEIRLESAKPTDLVIDGQRTIELGTDDVIGVKKLPHPALFVDAGQNFFAKVDRKLRHL
jgi:NAD+ kinase